MSIQLKKIHTVKTGLAGLARHVLDISPTGTMRGAGGDVPALDGELNRQVYGLFGLSDDEVKMIEGVKDEKAE